MAHCLAATSPETKKAALHFVRVMLCHLDEPLLRVELMKYVSIGMWSTMQDDRIRAIHIDRAPVAKFWKNATKKFDKAGFSLYFLSLVF